MKVHVHQNAKAINRTLIHTHKHTQKSHTLFLYRNMVSIRSEYWKAFLFAFWPAHYCMTRCVFVCMTFECGGEPPCPAGSVIPKCVCVCVCTTGPCASYSACLCFIKTPLNFLILHNQKQLQRILLIHTHPEASVSSVFLLHTHPETLGKGGLV